ncbi:hypothetical protein TSUD_165700 [Trifolium subterraneum]|uniref:Kelch repeat-containing protein n=1 Tax=Trifolium subterraneum TaxID=3900 RepID=A0A2Z6NBC6_TRISU|nr:hypothetical protein TSUD_165700 [Trifolium subterraneum]
MATTAIHHQKHTSSSTKTIIIFLFFSTLIGIAFVAYNIFHASFSSTPISITTNIVVDNPNSTTHNENVVNNNNNNNVKEKISERFLSATFADLPAPQLNWEQMPTAPVPRLDGYSIQIDNLFYVFCGYANLDHVHSHVDVYDFKSNKWIEKFDTPKEMANSHLGIASDGRYIYIISGQKGTQCRGPTASAFVLDTKTKKWSDLPPLPFPRYAPATQLWRGRLHVMGGSKENRHTPGLDHWSLAVKDGKALEKQWRTEIPIPRGGPHRACIVVNDRLYVIGGQEVVALNFRTLQVVYGDVYMLDEEMKWKVLPPMPKPNSHIECAWKWSVIGKLPYRIKTTLAGYWDGWLYFTSGQRDRGPDNPQPRKVVGETWRTKLSLP